MKAAGPVSVMELPKIEESVSSGETSTRFEATATTTCTEASCDVHAKAIFHNVVGDDCLLHLILVIQLWGHHDHGPLNNQGWPCPEWSDAILSDHATNGIRNTYVVAPLGNREALNILLGHQNFASIDMKIRVKMLISIFFFQYLTWPAFRKVNIIVF